MVNYLQLKDISAYRSEIMGWAIVWIMMLHFGFYVLKPLGFVAQYGYAGVDIFMFMSGFGLFFSLEKALPLRDFYTRRLKRIFPAYYAVGFFASFLLFHDNLLQYLFRFTTIGFWTGGLYAEWYVPSIVLLYVASPLLKRLGIYGQVGLAILLLVVACILVEREDLIDGEHYFMLLRVPAFLWGMVCASWLKEGRSMAWFYVVLIACLPFFVWLYPYHHQVYMYKYLSVSFLLPVFLCLFMMISRGLKCMNPVMRYIGRASLEIYLIQFLFFTMLLNDMIMRSDLATIGMIIISSLLGILLHQLLERKLL